MHPVPNLWIAPLPWKIHVSLKSSPSFPASMSVHRFRFRRKPSNAQLSWHSYFVVGARPSERATKLRQASPKHALNIFQDHVEAWDEDQDDRSGKQNAEA